MWKATIISTLRYVMWGEPYHSKGVGWAAGELRYSVARWEQFVESPGYYYVRWRRPMRDSPVDPWLWDALPPFPPFCPLPIKEGKASRFGSGVKDRGRGCGLGRI